MSDIIYDLEEGKADMLHHEGIAQSILSIGFEKHLMNESMASLFSHGNFSFPCSNILNTHSGVGRCFRMGGSITKK